MKLIVALDFEAEAAALAFIEQLDPNTCALKVGLEMYTLFGPNFVRALIKRQFKVFLDLKFHDIPNTVAHARAAAADLGVWMLNVHAVGGIKMMQSASTALEIYGQERPLLIAVTVLTSLGNDDLIKIGIGTQLSAHIQLLASLTQKAGLDGVVCSASGVPMIKSTCGVSFLTVTPGIRMASDATHDQVRTVTPQQAIELGSDYLVVGRSITQASHPAARIQDILKMVHV